MTIFLVQYRDLVQDNRLCNSRAVISDNTQAIKPNKCVAVSGQHSPRYCSQTTVPNKQPLQPNIIQDIHTTIFAQLTENKLQASFLKSSIQTGKVTEKATFERNFVAWASMNSAVTNGFLPRDAMRKCKCGLFCHLWCPSVMLVYCIQMAEDNVKLLSQLSSPIILVF